MTKVMLKIDKKDGSVFFDCMNHAGFKHVCITCSTLSKVVLAGCGSEELAKVMIADAHVQVTIDKASDSTIQLFEAVREVFKDAEEPFPEHIKIY